MAAKRRGPSKVADATAEERRAWDTYAAGALAGLKVTSREDSEDDGWLAAAYADDVLLARRKRFGKIG